MTQYKVILNSSENTNSAEESNAEDIFVEGGVLENTNYEIMTSEIVLKEKPFSGYLRGVPGGLGVLKQEYDIFQHPAQEVENRNQHYHFYHH